jgi:hypothetical protein
MARERVFLFALVFTYRMAARIVHVLPTIVEQLGLSLGCNGYQIRSLQPEEHAALDH